MPPITKPTSHSNHTNWVSQKVQCKMVMISFCHSPPKLQPKLSWELRCCYIISMVQPLITPSQTPTLRICGSFDGLFWDFCVSPNFITFKLWMRSGLRCDNHCSNNKCLFLSSMIVWLTVEWNDACSSLISL